jgi:hypothetical protein
VWLYVDRSGVHGVVAAVPDADGFVRPTGERGRDEYVAAGAAPCLSRRCLYVGERGKPGAPARRHDLGELGQGGGRGGLEAVDGDRGAQSEGDGGHLVRVEQQRWHRAAGREPVAAGPAGLGVDAVAELTQLGDVAARGALGDAEPGREPGGGDARVCLQQGECLEAAIGGSRCHTLTVAVLVGDHTGSHDSDITASS